MLRKQSALTSSTNFKSLTTSQIVPAHTQFFKTITRQKNPAWGNRFVKDSYDLTYDIKNQLVKQRSDKKVINYDIQMKRSLSKNQLKQSEKLKSSALRSQVNSRIKQNFQQKAGIQPSKYQVIIKHSNLQQIPNMQFARTIGSLSKFGLSNHEYKKTIQGKIEDRSSHHIKFQKRTSRKININEVFYRKDKDIETPLQKKQILDQHSPKIRIHRSHSFKSYEGHKVFQPALSLDKFYDLKKSIQSTRPTIKQSFYDMQKPLGRKNWPKKEGTQLSYNYQEIIQKIKPRILSSKMSNSKRQIRFSKQVISNVRGCSR